jgi:hypothetical protein
MANYVRDAMHTALFQIYGTYYTADMEALYWVSQGFAPSGPGDRATWFASMGAAGVAEGDLELDFWLNVFTVGGSFWLLLESGFALLTESGNVLRKE